MKGSSDPQLLSSGARPAEAWPNRMATPPRPRQTASARGLHQHVDRRPPESTRADWQPSVEDWEPLAGGAWVRNQTGWQAGRRARKIRVIRSSRTSWDVCGFGQCQLTTAHHLRVRGSCGEPTQRGPGVPAWRRPRDAPRLEHALVRRQSGNWPRGLALAARTARSSRGRRRQARGNSRPTAMIGSRDRRPTNEC